MVLKQEKVLPSYAHDWKLHVGINFFNFNCLWRNRKTLWSLCTFMESNAATLCIKDTINPYKCFLKKKTNFQSKQPMTQ